MKLPNFIIAGFPKCGSTSLYYYLEEHPEIFLPIQKELHYFTYDILANLNAGKDDNYVQKFNIGTLDKYKSCYADASTQKVIGDVSPSYAYYDSCFPKLKETLGDNIKVIVLLRDPVERAYSNYLHLVREGRENLSFYDALMAEKSRREKGYSDFWYYTFLSSYFDRLKKLNENFSNIHIVTFEAFVKNPTEGVKEIYSFLEVDDSYVPKNIDIVFNLGGVYVENALTKFIFRQSGIKNLLKRIFTITPWMKKWKLNSLKKYKKNTPKIDALSKEYLIELFAEDVKRLKREFGVQTEFWSNFN